MIGLGIESTCDETSIAIVENGKTVLALETYSQIPTHARYGGVVPELASREHLLTINFLLEKALANSKLTFQNLDYIAVSNRPGLMGSLLVGATLARSIHFATGIKIVPVNHLEAHLTVSMLEGETIEFPCLGLLLSGGNSAIYRYVAPGNLEILGTTIDDAIGEAFDKSATILGFSYPGGKEIEALAEQFVKPQSHVSLFSKLMKEAGPSDCTFSFSGIKTAVSRAAAKGIDRQQIAHDFQETVFELVLRNLEKAISLSGIKSVLAGGGVLANSKLQTMLLEFGKRKQVKVIFPKKKILCTDNGAMVAVNGSLLFQQGKTSGVDFLVSPRAL